MTIDDPSHMRAMRLHRTGSFGEDSSPLQLDTVAVPRPADDECLVRVETCGACHTELDIIEARTPPPSLPLIPGHQVTGTVVKQGIDVTGKLVGARVGVAWIWSACGACRCCTEGRENLCARFRATGRDRHGGYAEYMTVPAAFVHLLPPTLNGAGVAPLLCAGAVGYRALRLCELRDGDRLGLTGFGASGQLVIRMASVLYPDSEIAVFARNPRERELAMDMGAHWAGDTQDDPPFALDAVIDTTPAWLPVSAALSRLRPGGRLVINAIRKEGRDRAILSQLDYESQLWMEKSIRSVANVTRRDVRECLDLAASAGIAPPVTTWPLHEANSALHAIRDPHRTGAQVLVVEH